MKSDELYPQFLTYLIQRMIDGKISKGSFSLLKMSKSTFEDFKYKYDNDELFQSKIIELHKSETRDQKIDDIFDDFD